MSVKSSFSIVKGSNPINIKYFNDNATGYCLTAKDVVYFQDAIAISRLVFFEPFFSSKIAKMKIEGKFERLINLINLISQDEDDGEDDDVYRLALDEVEKFKKELKTKYRRLLKQEEIDLMVKKVTILENELNLRIKYFDYYKKEKEESKGRAR